MLFGNHNLVIITQDKRILFPSGKYSHVGIAKELPGLFKCTGHNNTTLRISTNSGSDIISAPPVCSQADGIAIGIELKKECIGPPIGGQVRLPAGKVASEVPGHLNVPALINRNCLPGGPVSPVKRFYPSRTEFLIEPGNKCIFKATGTRSV